jgi:hypothetical protein
MNNSTEMAGSRTQRRRMPSVEGYYDEIPAHERGQTKSNDKVSPVKHDYDYFLVQVTYIPALVSHFLCSAHQTTTPPTITTLFIV